MEVVEALPDDGGGGGGAGSGAAGGGGGGGATIFGTRDNQLAMAPGGGGGGGGCVDDVDYNASTFTRAWELIDGVWTKLFGLSIHSAVTLGSGGGGGGGGGIGGCNGGNGGRAYFHGVQLELRVWVIILQQYLEVNIVMEA